MRWESKRNTIKCCLENQEGLGINERIICSLTCCIHCLDLVPDNLFYRKLVVNSVNIQDNVFTYDIVPSKFVTVIWHNWGLHLEYV
jgi:hypothetical protein